MMHDSSCGCSDCMNFHVGRFDRVGAPRPPAVPADAEMRAIAGNFMDTLGDGDADVGIYWASQDAVDALAAVLTRLRDETRLATLAPLLRLRTNDETIVIDEAWLRREVAALRSAAETPKETK